MLLDYTIRLTVNLMINCCGCTTIETVAKINKLIILNSRPCIYTLHEINSSNEQKNY